jgi:hypothetical protein
MQFDVLRAFPYPVLRPGVNDYVDGEIQASVQLRQATNGSEVLADVHFALSVPAIRDLIEEGLARYVVVFSCRDTYLRKAVLDAEPSFSCQFGGGSLRGDVGIYPYVVAIADISGYVCDWINSEFGTGPFNFKRGSVIALDQPQSVYIDRESYRPISSAFVLVKDESLLDFEWRIDAAYDKVRIAASPSLKARIDVARNSPQNQAILLNSIYFAAVMQCVSLLRQTADYDEYRWAGIFRQRCTDVGSQIESEDESRIAQRLMKQPFALIDTYFFGDAGAA